MCTFSGAEGRRRVSAASIEALLEEIHALPTGRQDTVGPTAVSGAATMSCRDRRDMIGMARPLALFEGDDADRLGSRKARPGV